MVVLFVRRFDHLYLILSQGCFLDILWEFIQVQPFKYTIVKFKDGNNFSIQFHFILYSRNKVAEQCFVSFLNLLFGDLYFLCDGKQFFTKTKFAINRNRPWYYFYVVSFFARPKLLHLFLILLYRIRTCGLLLPYACIIFICYPHECVCKNEEIRNILWKFRR